MTDLSKLPAVDPEVPNAARMYDYYLGGSHNFAADRAAAEKVKAAIPYAVDVARANRFFLQRAVRFCVEEGLDQFLDLGSGIPTVGNVHEAARALNPAARVAYVDNEPVTVASAAALLEGDPLATITAADIRDPDSVFAAPGVCDLLDLTRPVALLTVAVLPFVPDEDDPVALAEHYRSRLAPGQHPRALARDGRSRPGRGTRLDERLPHHREPRDAPDPGRGRGPAPRHRTGRAGPGGRDGLAAGGHDRGPAPRPVGGRRPHPLNASVITADFHEPVTMEVTAGNSALVY